MKAVAPLEGRENVTRASEAVVTAARRWSPPDDRTLAVVTASKGYTPGGCHRFMTACKAVYPGGCHRFMTASKAVYMKAVSPLETRENRGSHRWWIQGLDPREPTAVTTASSSRALDPRPWARRGSHRLWI